MKRLVVCCDGTWNSPDARDTGGPAPTNVTKLALAIAPADAAGVEQRMFYHPGVGTKRSERIRGGTFGFGLSRNVRDCYRFLVATFEPGDEIFLFGFSRGAFTARSTAGLIRNAGILRPEHAGRVDEAFALYRDRTSQTHPRSVEATLFRQSYSYTPRIRFIGVWDTVGALGIPLNGLRFVNFLNRRNRFHDTILSTAVDAAFQACAIDEKRKPFRPTLWEVASNPPVTQVVQQVWFRGVHTDVGGGYYPDHGLSDISLLWMIQNAEGCNLAVDRAALEAGPYAWQTAEDPTVDPEVPAPNPLASPHNSYKGFYRLLGPYVRPIEATEKYRVSAASSAVDAGPQPANLKAYLDSPGHEITTVPTSTPPDG